MSKDEKMDCLKNASLNEKSETLKNIVFLYLV